MALGPKEREQKLERLKALAASDPEAARKLLEQITSKMLVPHAGGQQEVMDAQERFLILNAGRRWGKTKVGAARVLKLARRERKMIWWVAPTYKIVKRGYREVVRQLPDGVLAKPAPPDSAFDAGRAVVLLFKNGTRIEFYSAERPEGMLGEGVDFVLLDEAATMPRNVWEQIIYPTLADRQGGALFISTPRGRNWFYELWVRGQDKLQEAYKSWTFPSWTNPTIDPAEWEHMEETMPRAVYEQEIAADFISAAAAVFRIPDSGIKEQVSPRGQHVVMGVDLAKHHDFTVFDAVRAGDRLPVFHDRFNAVSWPEQRRRLHDAVASLYERGATGVTVVLDSTGIGDVVYDDLSFEGLDAIPVKFTQQWKQQAVMLLAADLERGNAFLHEDQTNEFNQYEYTMSETTGRMKFGAPYGSHDDEVSAKLLQHWGVVNEGVPDAQILGTGGLFEEAENEREQEATSVTVTEWEIGAAASPTELMLRDDVWV